MQSTQKARRYFPRVYSIIHYQAIHGTTYQKLNFHTVYLNILTKIESEKSNTYWNVFLHNLLKSYSLCGLKLGIDFPLHEHNTTSIVSAIRS